MSNIPFVLGLRTSGQGLDLSDGSSSDFFVRVQIHELWDAIKVRVSPSTSLSKLKAAALHSLLNGTAVPELYVSKFKGAEITNEALSVQQAGLLSGSTLLLHSRARRVLR